MPITKITSVCPATGWWAAYRDGEGFIFKRLAVFAAIETPSEDEDSRTVPAPEVVGMDAHDLASFSFSSENANFAGYYHESEFAVVGQELGHEADKRARSGGF